MSKIIFIMVIKMFYLKIIIFMLMNFTLAKSSNFIGTHDATLCIRSQPATKLSCNHQLEPDVRDLMDCEVETIAPNNCFVYDVDEVFDPRDLPFELFVYKLKHEVLRTVALSINFPQPDWKDMSFLLRNREQPQYKICREFRLTMEYPVNITNSLFWNCLLYSADVVEENFYTLFLEDNNNAGGSYSFRIPSVNNYDLSSSNGTARSHGGEGVKEHCLVFGQKLLHRRGCVGRVRCHDAAATSCLDVNSYINVSGHRDIDLTNETRWHVFFFLHQHYMESTGKLFITMQPAPFANISYSVSLVRCLNDSTRCDPNAVLQTIFINQERYSEEYAVPLTFELKKVTLPGKYAVTVQILSPFCDRSLCEVSISPVFELKHSYTVQILLGLLGIMLIIALLTFFVMRKIHLNFYDYIEGKLKNMDTVLFIYHADTEEMFYLFQILSKVFSEKFSIRPLLVDEHVGVKDPNDWTRHQLCHASKVLFFIPRATNRDSATPIQHQWQCAITYFSGSFLKENQSIDHRCAAVLLPDSSPPAEGNELYSLRRFDLKRDLASMINWFHRNTFADDILFWRPVARKVSKDLSPFIKYAVDPVLNRRPDLPIYLCRREEEVLRCDGKIGLDMHNATTKIIEDGVDSLDDFNLDSIDEKIRNEFDPLIPDVRRVRFLDNNNDDDNNESQSSDSDDEVSVNDVANFAT